MLTDMHLHIADEYSPLDIDKVKVIIENAKKHNIEYLVSNSTCLRTTEENILLMKQYNNVIAGLGIFPTEFKTSKDLGKINIIEKKIEELKKSGFGNRIIIGEVGLDFKDEKSNKEVQEKALITFLEIAKKNDLYIEIHSRFATKQTVALLEKFGYKKIIMHWFLDSKKYIDKVAKLGYYVTIGPKYLYDQNLMDNLKDLPKEQILFETDYPANVNGNPHYPEKINDLFNKYCKDFEIPKETMQKIQDKSFRTIFPNLI